MTDDTMEKLIYCSPKKYKILEIKQLLSKHNIPVTSIQLYICVNMSRIHDRGYDEIIDVREERGELTVPIEEFNEDLNDAETFEIYTEEKYADAALDLIDKYNENNFYNNCIFKSINYDEASDKKTLLLENKIPCDDIYIHNLDENTEEYLLFLDPNFMEKAEKIINNKNIQKLPIETERSIPHIKNDIFSQEKRGDNPFAIFLKVLFVVVIIFIVIYIFDKNYPFIDKLLGSLGIRDYLPGNR
jgi:hypothetical protein